MAHEARRGLVRIISNYTRLLITLGLGILVVPLTIGWLGDNAFGLISLLGANIGLAGIFRQIIQMSLIRELGAAYHLGDEKFQSNYRAICLISFICTLLSLVAFAIMIALLPLLSIPDEMLNASRVFVAGQGLYTAAMVFLAPMLNMYLVTERFVGYNIWYIGVRATNLMSVIILGYAIGIKDPARGLMFHGLLWSGLGIIGFVISAAYILTKDHRLMIRIRGVRREALKDVMHTFSWNSAVQVAMNLHEQIPQFLLNIFIGPLANAAWGIGFRFVSYIRMATTGIQFGSDAVSARLSSGDDDELSRSRLQRLIGIQTKLTAMIALPAGFVVFIYGWPIFHLWVGRRLENYEQVMPTAVIMTRILAWAIAARAISDTWLLILYGAGFVRHYALWVIAGGIIAPTGAITLMLLLPGQLAIFAPPAMLTAVLVCIHLLGFPFITGHCLHINPWTLIASLARPVIVSLTALACALMTLHFGSTLEDLGFTTQISAERAAQINWLWIMVSLGVFAFIYALLGYAFILGAHERERIKMVVARLTPGRSPKQ